MQYLLYCGLAASKVSASGIFELLAQFMRHGTPDAELFRESVGHVLASAHQRARSRNKRVTAFGEMVAILWNQGEKEAALRLEDLWNAALREHSFHLHCAYPRGIFDKVGDIDSVHSMHTHVVREEAPKGEQFNVDPISGCSFRRDL